MFFFRNLRAFECREKSLTDCAKSVDRRALEQPAAKKQKAQPVKLRLLTYQRRGKTPVVLGGRQDHAVDDMDDAVAGFDVGGDNVCFVDFYAVCCVNGNCVALNRGNISFLACDIG